MIPPDNFIHRRVCKKGVVQLIVSPLSVTEKVHDNIFPEASLVLHGQPCCSEHLLSVITVYVDYCTSHHFT